MVMRANSPQAPGYSRRGADMGRPDIVATISRHDRMYLQRVRLDSGGYDPGGAYWGHGEPLYYYYNETASGYVRGATRGAAKAAVRQLYPSAQFHR